MLQTQELTFVVATEAEEPTADMLIDIRPNPMDLTPVFDLPASMRPALVYLAGLSLGSRRGQAGALAEASTLLTHGQCTPEALPWHALTFAHTNALRALLAERHSAAYANKILSAVRGALKAAWQLGLMPADAYMRAAQVKPVKGGDSDDAAAGRALTPGEFTALLRTCAADQTPAGPRDAAIIGLGVVGGLRRGEIAALAIGDYNGTAVIVRKGKGNKRRTVPVATGLAAALADWVSLRGSLPGPLFHQVDKAGSLRPLRSISPAAIARIVNKRAAAAGVPAFSPHDMRRTFAGDLLDAGADISTVQKLMGHADPRTTSGYDRRGERAKVAAVGRLHMAWERRAIL